MAIARGPLLLAWQDDMFLRASWLVPELCATFTAYPELGLLCLSRGLTACRSTSRSRAGKIFDWRRLQSTIGPAPGNWFRLQEVDIVIRPWVVRRACLDRVGPARRSLPADGVGRGGPGVPNPGGRLAVATSGYERLGGYLHLGSTTIGAPSEAVRDRGPA